MTARQITEIFINRAKKLYRYNKYPFDYSFVKYINSKTKVDIICQIHGMFSQRPDHHLNEVTGCKKCYGEQITDRQKFTTNEFIKKSIKIHQDKYNYSLLKYINSHIEVNIICPIHGIFTQLPCYHLRGHGCKKCGHYRGSNKLKSTTHLFIETAMKTHQDKYDYSMVKYADNRTGVNIICKKHGLFIQTPHDHLSGSGCKKCSYKKRGDQYRMSINEFVKKANKIHQNKYDYSVVKYIDCKTKVEIICKLHGSFFQTPSHHLNGCGCKRCSHQGYSKKSIAWLESVKKNEFINILHAENGKEKKIGKYYADGFCKETNTIYEFHGCFWHSHNYKKCKNKRKFRLTDIHPIKKITHKNNYLATKRRERMIKKMGYNLVVIWECEWDKLC